jgi:small-conductance mechanosensitive channel
VFLVLGIVLPLQTTNCRSLRETSFPFLRKMASNRITSCDAMIRTELIRGLASFVLILFIAATASSGPQGAKKPTPPQAPSQPAAQATGTLPPLKLDGDAILHHLNQVISWYRHVTTGIRDVGLPSDAIYQDNAKALGEQAVELAFQSAKAETALVTPPPGTPVNPSSGENTQQQNLDQLKAKTSAQIDQLQSQVAALNEQLKRAPISKRTALISQRDALQGELDLQKSLLDAIQKMAAFMDSNGEATSGRGLEGDINRLAQTVPEVLTHPNTNKTAGTQEKVNAAKSPLKPSVANSGGLIGDAMTLYDYMSAIRQIDTIIKETNYTREAADQVRAPLRSAMRATIQQSQKLASQNANIDTQQLQAQRQEVQEINGRFNQLSNTLLPLSQEIVIINNSRTNLEQWRDSIARESGYVLRSVLLRVIAILVALGVILALSEVWRRVTFRYIGDPRRRRQFLVLRRIVIGLLVAVVLTFGFVSQFSSLATFAGFVTAGIAVGLQAVLLSIAAYFFIIGRYGIRVGDRISVAGVTGDVVDIGLVRMYVMELAGTGLDFYPTGRIVAFSNSVLFQTGTPLFRQIPGTEYTWHEVMVMISPTGNHKAAEEKIMAIVEQVYSKYRAEIERQHAAIERRVDIQIDMPRPEARLQFTDAGLELLVRYPVEIRNAPKTDEEMTKKVLDAIAKDEELKATVTGTPKIRSAIKG